MQVKEPNLEEFFKKSAEKKAKDSEPSFWEVLMSKLRVDPKKLLALLFLIISLSFITLSIVENYGTLSGSKTILQDVMLVMIAFAALRIYNAIVSSTAINIKVLLNINKLSRSVDSNAKKSSDLQAVMKRTVDSNKSLVNALAALTNLLKIRSKK